MNGFHTILFDLDGTLTDPEEGITKSVQYALRAFGIEEADRRKLQPFIGPPLMDSFQEFYGFSEQQSMAAVEKYREYFREQGIFENIPYPGMQDMLRKLKKQGRVLAVASSKPEPFVERILEHFEMAEYFDVVVGATMDEKRSRKEEVVEETLARLAALGETDKSRMVMVGDRKFDVTGAHAFGLQAIGVTYGYAKDGELEEAGADLVVHNVEELGRALMGETV